MPVPHLYLRGDAAPPTELRGTRLRVTNGPTGGHALEVHTDPLDAHKGVVAVFRPAIQQRTERAPGTEGALDDDNFRDIPYDNVWACAMLLSRDKKVGVRMAPRHPKPREPVTCTEFGTRHGSPDTCAQAWVHHLVWHVQSAAGLPFVCGACLPHTRL